MSGELSEPARRILEAGLSAASEDGGDRLARADRAVADAVGELCLDRPDDGELTAMSSLIEIAQMHVRKVAGSRG